MQDRKPLILTLILPGAEDFEIKISRPCRHIEARVAAPQDRELFKCDLCGDFFRSIEGWQLGDSFFCEADLWLNIKEG